MIDAPKTITVTLNEPVQIEKRVGKEVTVETYSELTFRRAKGRDMLIMDKVKGEMAKTTAMYASMAGVPFQVFEEMDADDFQRVMVEVAPLLGNSAVKALEEAAARAAKEASPE